MANFSIESGSVLTVPRRCITRRTALGALAGGMTAVAWSSSGLARKRRGRGVGAESAGGTRKRPIGDFLDAQGTTQVFVPPIPDVVGWATPSDTPVLFAWVDYPGGADGFQGLKLGTKTSGKVSEKRLKDGRAEVKVELKTTNALAWVIELDLGGDILDQIANKQPIFGYRPQEAAMPPKPKPSLIESKFEVEFINTAPGAPLPDLVKATALGEAPEGFELLTEKFEAKGRGTIRAGQNPGHLLIVQVGIRLNRTNPDCNTTDCFPVEIVRVQPVGN
jgi:hypothetical protein